MPGLSFHHVGIACRDLNEETAKLRWLGYVQEGSDFEDPVQGIRGRFLSAQTPRLELLVSSRDPGVLDPWLNGGVKMYHLAYLTQELEQSIEALRKQRAKLVVSPIPAVAFGGRRIAFLMLANRMLVELISACWKCVPVVRPLGFCLGIPGIPPYILLQGFRAQEMRIWLNASVTRTREH
jgi:methylmalonyl-CoA/ethylmalonyl-CoA epimerase